MDGHVDKMEAQLRWWNTRFEELAAKIGKDSAADCSERIDDLKAKHAAAQAKLDEFKAAGDGQWERFRTDIWIAWNELENAFSDFQKFALTTAIERIRQSSPD